MPNMLPRVLIISSTDPTKSTGIVALNFYHALKAYGHEVDFLTKYRVEGHREFDYVLDLKRWPNYLRYKRDKRIHRSSGSKGWDIAQQGNHSFDYSFEDDPPIPTELILRKIKKQYDVVFIVFWYQMLSYQTIDAIYNKLHCQIHFRCPDNQPIAGGCHFIGGCARLSQGCGFCPGLKNSAADDFTHHNVIYRRKVLEHVRPIVYGNTHMQQIYKQSALLKDYDRLETVYPLVDNEFFHPIDKQKAKQSYCIPDDKKFVLFFGCTILSEERKGMRYLLEALQQFHDQLTEKQRSSVLLLIAGYSADDVLEKMPFDYQYVGYVPLEQLPVVYSLSNAFLCPSIDDAGPSMVNQSLSCGTPVVAFNIGTALDMVLNHNTGYCAQLRDSADFAKGIQKIFSCSETDYHQMCNDCRLIALERTTEDAFVKNFLRVYQKYAQ